MTFLPSKWSKKGLFFGLFGDSLFFRYFHSGNHGKQSKNPFSQNKQKLSTFALKVNFWLFCQSKWWKNGLFFGLFGDSLFFRYFHSGNHGKQSKNPFSQNKQKLSTFALKVNFCLFCQSKWWKNGLFLHFLEIVYFFVISTQGIMGNKLRTLFHKISKNYPLLHWRSIFDFSASQNGQKMVHFWTFWR